MNIAEQEKIIQKLYYDPARGFHNANKLYTKVKDLGIKLKFIKDYINKQRTRQLYYRPQKRISYYPITGPTYSYQADLIFFPKLKEYNNGYNTALTIIEVTSRMGYLMLMKGKKNIEVVRIMNEFLVKEQMKNLMTDAGSEFISIKFKNLMKKYNINHYVADAGDHHKLGMIERYNRTIKFLINQYMTAYKTKKWIDIVITLVKNYNTTKHSSTGYALAKVGYEEHALI